MEKVWGKLEKMTDTSSFFEVCSFTNGNFPTIQEFPSPLQMGVMPLVVKIGNEIQPLGTCFAISSQGLVLTARHVLDEGLKLAGLDRKQKTINVDDMLFGALYVAQPGTGVDVPDLLGGFLPVRAWDTNNSFDIALLHLVLPVNEQGKQAIRMPSFRLSVGMPDRDQMCFALGYHSMTCETAEDDVRNLSISQEFSASKGNVLEVHFPKRDSVMLPFPCFEVSARFDPGMSGGPVFTTDGNLIGVVCSGFEKILSDGYISYGSLIVTALCLGMTLSADDGYDAKALLPDFIEGGSVSVDETYGAIDIKRIAGQMIIQFQTGQTINANF